MKNLKKIIITILIVFPYFILFYLLIGNYFHNISKNNLVNNKENNFFDKGTGLKKVQEKNLYKYMSIKFNDIKDEKSFNLFNKEPLHLMYVIALQKDKDKKKWDKYTSYMYKYDIKIRNTIKSLDDFKDLSKKYFSIKDYNKDNLDLKDINYDIDIIFSSVDLKKGIQLCNDLFSSKIEKDTCIDHVIFARATKFNLYCNNISDKIRSKFCFDYFKTK